MANLLEFVRVLLSDPTHQRHFSADPYGYLVDHQFDRISGEDVIEAIPLVMRGLPRPLTERLAPYRLADQEALPPARPMEGESGLDAAVRQLTFATSLTAGLVAVGGIAPDEPDVHAGHAGAAPTDAGAVPLFDVQEGESERTAGDSATIAAHHAERGDVTDVTDQIDLTNADQEVETVGRERVASAGVADRTDPFATFGEEIAGIVRFATERMKELNRKATQRHDAIIHAAEQEAEAVRRTAQAEADNLRATAQAEADAILAAAKSAREEARVFRQAAKDDAAAMLAEARARRDEVREAERQLRKRLASLESVFRTLQTGSVLPDDDEEPRPPASG